MKVGRIIKFVSPTKDEKKNILLSILPIKNYLPYYLYVTHIDENLLFNCCLFTYFFIFMFCL